MKALWLDNKIYFVLLRRQIQDWHHFKGRRKSENDPGVDFALKTNHDLVHNQVWVKYALSLLKAES